MHCEGLAAVTPDLEAFCPHSAAPPPRALPGPAAQLHAG